MTLHFRRTLDIPALDQIFDEPAGYSPAKRFYRRRFKRALDIVLVLCISLPALVLILVSALLVSLDGHSPFYRQRRIGKNGKVFTMWKLRSMIANSDAVFRAHLAADPAARLEWDRDQKLRNDPRVTAVGRFIRKTSIDELPQLWNVLRGDMSIVGPRPMMPEQQLIYPGTAYYAMRPGITGFWQVSVRNDSSFADRARFDTEYLREMSLLTDISVIARTVRVVADCTGR